MKKQYQILCILAIGSVCSESHASSAIQRATLAAAKKINPRQTRKVASDSWNWAMKEAKKTSSTPLPNYNPKAKLPNGYDASNFKVNNISIDSMSNFTFRSPLSDQPGNRAIAPVVTKINGKTVSSTMTIGPDGKVLGMSVVEITPNKNGHLNLSQQSETFIYPTAFEKLYAYSYLRYRKLMAHLDDFISSK